MRQSFGKCGKAIHHSLHQTNMRRAGFTLLELLVVILVISILLALTAAGVFQVVQTQRENNTKNTMKAVNKLMQQQIKIVLDKANKETVPPSVLALAGNDPHRARVIWKKLRLKQEFPMTFAEAMYPYLFYVDVNTPTPPGWMGTQWATYNPTAGWNPSPPTFATSPMILSPTDLPPKPSYVKAIKSIMSVNCGPRLPTDSRYTSNPAGWPFLESSTCLLLALQEKREGVGLNVDELGSAAVDLNGDGLKEFVDGWGNPIAFFRFPTSNDGTISGNNIMDSANPAGSSDTASKFRDPLDPEGLLLNQSVWNNFVNWQSQSGVHNFEQLCHLVHVPTTNPTSSTYNQVAWGSVTISNGSRYMVASLVSSGADGKWGLNNLFNFTPQTAVNPDMSVDPETFSVTPSGIVSGQVGNRVFSPADANDNIYSFLLQ